MFPHPISPERTAHLFNELPGADCMAPRDRLSLAKTEDVLFLATLLTRAESFGYLLGMVGPDKRRVFIPEPGGNHSDMGSASPRLSAWPLFYEWFPSFRKVAGMDGYRVKSRTSAASIRTSIRERYFPFRQFLVDGNKLGMTVRVDDHSPYAAGIFKNDPGHLEEHRSKVDPKVLTPYEKLSAQAALITKQMGHPFYKNLSDPLILGINLKWPFKKDDDLLLRDLYKTPFFTWEKSTGTGVVVDVPFTGKAESEKANSPELAAESLPEKTQGTKPDVVLYCPLDGPVLPLKIKVETGENSWRLNFGREWELLVCPHCLGVFDRKLTRMN